MRYKNKRTGMIVEPSCDVAAQSFARSAEWEEFKARPKGRAKQGKGQKPDDEISTEEENTLEDDNKPDDESEIDK